MGDAERLAKAKRRIDDTNAEDPRPEAAWASRRNKQKKCF